MLRNAGPGSTRIILNRSSTVSSTSTISPSCSMMNNPAGNTVLKLSPACCFLSLEDQRKSYLEPPSYKMSSTPSHIPLCLSGVRVHPCHIRTRIRHDDPSLDRSSLRLHREGFVAPVLAYAIEYFQTHQSAPSEKWLET